MIQFKQEICGNLDAALRREWLETNGLGGFASSTIIGLNTRRYHGLLVAATKPPVGRLVLLSKLEETVLIDGRAFDLCSNQYQGVVHPKGFQYLKQFRLEPFPIFTFEVQRIQIEKTVFMVQGADSIIRKTFSIPAFCVSILGRSRGPQLSPRPSDETSQERPYTSKTNYPGGGRSA